MLGTRSPLSLGWFCVASLALTMAPSLGCGSPSEANPGSGSHPDGAIPTPGADATTDADAGDVLSDASSDAVVETAVDAPAPARICTSDSDCLAVLDYRDGFECWVPTAASTGPPDCAALQSAYVQGATAAQQCDPTQDAAVCIGEYPDTCGCGAAFNFSGRAGTTLECAFQAMQNSQCSFPTCEAGTTCPTVPANGAATCVANESGASGTCAWVK